MTKIDIISGFLGAGKTTFIKKMIDEVFKGETLVLDVSKRQLLNCGRANPMPSHTLRIW